MIVKGYNHDCTWCNTRVLSLAPQATAVLFYVHARVLVGRAGAVREEGVVLPLAAGAVTPPPPSIKKFFVFILI
jgi:hypothetical protein